MYHTYLSLVHLQHTTKYGTQHSHTYHILSNKVNTRRGAKNENMEGWFYIKRKKREKKEYICEGGW